LVYDLPVGRGKQFANQVNPVVNAVIGGWEGTTIATFQQGFPTSIQCNDYYAPTKVGGLLDIGTGGGINRCDHAGDPKNLKWTHNSSDFAANAALFAAPTPGVFGNSARNVATAPGLENFVLGLYKNTNITERVKFQLRFEAFNAFNHPQFDADPSQSSFSGGGSSVTNSLSTGQLGLISAAGAPRILQIGGKLVF
jgi:hypothetical protein